MFRWSGVASRGKLAGKTIPVADLKTEGMAEYLKKVQRSKKVGKQSQSTTRARRKDQVTQKEPTPVHEEETPMTWVSYKPPTPPSSSCSASDEYELALRSPNLGLGIFLTASPCSPQRWYDMPITDDDTELAVAQRFPSPETMSIPSSLCPIYASSEVRLVLDYCKSANLGTARVLADISQTHTKHPHD